MTKTIVRVPAVVGVLLAVAPAEPAQDNDGDLLFNECRPMSLYVDGPLGGPTDPWSNLSDNLRNMAESRLRRAGLYDPNARSYFRFEAIVVDGL